MPKLIAETAWHHEGDLAFLLELVDAIGAARCADVLKVHVTLDLDEYMSQEHELYQTLSGMLLSEAEWEKVGERARSLGLELMMLVNDRRAVRLAARLEVELVEIHALCLGDPRLLDAARETLDERAEMVLGVGGSELAAIRWAMQRLGRERALLMFGFQNFPTRFEQVNFARMRRIRHEFPGCRFGYADHCSWDEPHNEVVTLLGAAQEMDFVEKHVTTRPGEKRLDYQAAISVASCRRLREHLDVLESCEGDGRTEMGAEESGYARPGRMAKVAVLEAAGRAGERLHLDSTAFRRVPVDGGLSGPQLERMLPGCLVRDRPAGHVLCEDDIEARGTD